jgi:hypothetical protein
MEGSDKRTLREITDEIEADWVVIKNRGARKAFECMKMMDSVEAPFGADPNGYAVIRSFLCNSLGWRGPVARRVKQELRVMCGLPRP